MPFAKKNLHVQLCLGHQTSSLNYQRHRHVNKTRRQTTWVCKFQVLITSCEKASQWEPWISAGKNGWYPINLDTKFRIPIIESKKWHWKECDESSEMVSQNNSRIPKISGRWDQLDDRKKDSPKIGCPTYLIDPGWAPKMIQTFQICT